MMTNAELKARAKRGLKGNWITTLAVVALAVLFTVLGRYLKLLALPYAFLVIGPINYGQRYYCLRLNSGNQHSIGQLFAGFTDYVNVILLNLMSMVFILLWSLLLIVPGIVKMLSYRMAAYILAENRGISAREALSRSKKMMEGHKMELFLLNLSFMGWILLSCLTLGIGFLYTVPYMEAACAEFYRNLSETSREKAALSEESGTYCIPEKVRCQDGGIKRGTVVLDQTAQTQLLNEEENDFNTDDEACGIFIGLEGGLKGQEYSMPNGMEIILGRDVNRCSILTSQNNFSIGRCHCILCYRADRDGYVVKDISSNGVFLADGSRIKKNTDQFMPHGSMLYLGDRKESFRLE